jgi:O-acetyl-ADP-ribose deacetylase (regulator of RNase III)
MQARTYTVGRSSITLRFGDITESRAEALVSSDDYMLSMGGGVSAALRSAGGSHVAADASKMVPAKVGDVVVSSAGGLQAKYIFHAVTIGAQPHEMQPAVIVRQTSQRAMRLLAALGCKSIAFPAIGAGMAGISIEIVSAEMATTLVESVLDTQTPYQIELYLMDRFRTMRSDDFFVFFEQFAARQLGVAARPSAGGHVLATPLNATPGMDPEQASQANRRHEVYTMLRHLDARRNKLEADLIKTLAGDDAPDAVRLAALKEQLEQIQTLRRGYEGEILPNETLRQRIAPNSVFVSSTSSDLKPHRLAVRASIEGLNLRFIGMEDFEATGAAPADLIRQKVRESESYVGILGMRYGYVDPGTGLSMTELEYRQAIASAKPMHIFVMDDQAPITAGMVETDSVRFARLLEFKSRVLKDHTCKLFTNPDDLASKARDTLRPQAT